MKKTKLIILLVAFALLIGSAWLLYDRLGENAAPDQLQSQKPEQTPPSQTPEAPEDTETPEEDEDIPALDFTVYDAEGSEVKLSDYFGKPLVLNFWASWCGPCKTEMPEFQAVFEQRGEEVQFLLVNMTTSQRESFETASNYVAEQGFTFPVLYDLESSAAITYGVQSLPTTYFISAEGNVIAGAMGAIDADTLNRGIAMITE